jgi:hypothetical protein
MSIAVIKRKNIPESDFNYDDPESSKSNYHYKITFDNGLEYYYIDTFSNVKEDKPILTQEAIKTVVHDGLSYMYDQYTNGIKFGTSTDLAENIRNYYCKQGLTWVNYTFCKKMYNYFHDNEDKIKEIVYTKVFAESVKVVEI